MPIEAHEKDRTVPWKEGNELIRIGVHWMRPQPQPGRRWFRCSGELSEEGWDVCVMRWMRAPIFIIQQNVALSGLYPHARQVRPGLWVDLCCGLGGMTSGLELEGEHTGMAVDKDKTADLAWNRTFEHGAVHGRLDE